MGQKITYLLGAGASYGTRNNITKNNEFRGAISTGVPIISEFIQTLKHMSSHLPYPTYKDIAEEIQWLYRVCVSYPTVDTYAKQLYVCRREEDYIRLKNALSTFLTLIQHSRNRDQRYDGFIASIIKEGKKFPDDISILSWNYDCQFEFAYAAYIDKQDRRLDQVWNECNVNLKPMISHDNNDKFNIVKLNGTALLYNTSQKHLMDVYFDNGMDFCDCYTNYIHSDNIINTLSFAWEQDEDFLAKIADNVKNTEILVVIGYSFPYVNREVDRTIINSMINLKKVYIQDPNAEDIKESFEATLNDNSRHIEYSLRKNLSQLVIPNELA